jgi:hypothetical protein
VAETQRAYHQRRLEALKTLRQPWEDVWSEIDQLLVPGYVRLNPSDKHADRGNRRRLDILDNRGQIAHRIFRSGMQSGMTSKARPWNRLSTHDLRLRELDPVKQFLDVTTLRMREVMNKSNIYDTFHTKYGALGAVGTAVSYMSPDPIYVVRNNYVIAGHYWIATNHLGFVDTLYHVIPMNAQQIVGMFTEPGDNIPRVVQKAYDDGNRDQTYLVYHAMEPRTHRDTDRADRRNMPFLSNYWMLEDDDKDRMLRESGSAVNRVIGSRWDTVGEDPYGYSLGMDALADIKQLQHEQARKLEILDKTTRPPMTAPASMKGKRHSLLPGSVTFSDQVHQSGGYRPALDLTSYNMSGLLEDIRYLHSNIDETFYVSLFMAVSNMPGVQPRNEFEIAERKEERLLQLGPALDRLQSEELQPTIGICYHYMKEAGLLPELPEELEAEEGELTVEYTSIMAQAQRAVGVNSIERLASYIGTLAEAKPEVLDKFDADQSIDEYADRIGTPTAIVVSDEQVAKVRQKRAEEAQQEKNLAAAATAAPALKQGADAARLLAEANDTRGQGMSPTTLIDQLNLA